MAALKSFLKTLGIDYKALALLSSGATIARCKGMDKKLLDGIYAMGHQHYVNRNFELACKIFRYLCIHDHTEARYMSALGACEYQRGEYTNAQNILKNAASLDRKDPRPLLNLAMSMMATGENEEAQDVLEKVIGLSKQHKQFRHELTSAQALLSATNAASQR